MAATVAGLWFVEDVLNGQGFDHPDYPRYAIKQAPDGLYRHRQVLPVAVFYGVLVCLFTVVGMAIGLNDHTKKGVGAKVFWIAAVVYALLFLAVAVVGRLRTLLGTKKQVKCQSWSMQPPSR